MTQEKPNPSSAPGVVLRTAILLFIYGIAGLIYLFWVIQGSYGAIFLAIDGLVFILVILTGSIWTIMAGLSLISRKKLPTNNLGWVATLTILPASFAAYDIASYYGMPIIGAWAALIGGLIIFYKKLSKDIRLVMILIAVPTGILAYDILRHSSKTQIIGDLTTSGLFIFVIILYHHLQASIKVLKRQQE
ncbi:MAG: hypothetical protein Q7S23_01290 [bacterium]|nr:hypothetical protein [bacterium]